MNVAKALEGKGFGVQFLHDSEGSDYVALIVDEKEVSQFFVSYSVSNYFSEHIFPITDCEE